MDFWDFHTHQSGRINSIRNADLDTLPELGTYSLGIHPWDLEKNWEQKLAVIAEEARGNLAVLAIGECGFDRPKGPDLKLQKAAISAQGQLALELDIPVILHCVKSHDLLLEYLKTEQSIPNIIWHGWNLKPELGRILLEYPVYFSFGRHLLFPQSQATQWLKLVPIDRVFLETDDADNEISEIYQAASLILGLSMDHLDLLVRENWNKISSRKIK